jgi:hypothetical protein
MLKFKAVGFLIEILDQVHVSASKIVLKNMTANLDSFSAVYVFSDFGLRLHRIEGLTLWKVIIM